MIGPSPLIAVDPGKTDLGLAFFSAEGELKWFRYLKGAESSSRSEIAWRNARAVLRECEGELCDDPIWLAVEGPAPGSRMIIGKDEKGKPKFAPTSTQTIEDLARCRQALHDVLRQRAKEMGVSFRYTEPTPTAAKKVTGSGRASKEDVLKWAEKRWPQIETIDTWRIILRGKKAGQREPTKAGSAVADAICVGHAALQIEA